MPIGKSALKRVENNGYSAVKTSAPDMENSTVVEKKSAPVSQKTAKETVKKPAAAKKTAKKPEAKKPETKKPETKKPEAKKPAAKKAPAKIGETKAPVVKAVETATGKDGFEKVSLGGEMPVYLL